MQVHRDIMDGRYSMPPFNGATGVTWVAPTARVDPGATLEGPLFIDEGCSVEAGARLGPYTVLGRNSHIEQDANISGAIVWPDSRIGREAIVTDTIIGRSGQIGRNAHLRGGVLGDSTSVAEYSRL
jgi:NDP-sugar pyrophosphorylase family protein